VHDEIKRRTKENTQKGVLAGQDTNTNMASVRQQEVSSASIAGVMVVFDTVSMFGLEHIQRVQT